VVVDVGLTVVLPDAASFVLKFVPVQEDEDGVSVPDIIEELSGGGQRGIGVTVNVVWLDACPSGPVQDIE
jgi:hypothetical protein